VTEVAEEQSGPLSWRDVYRAVGDSETRLLAALDKWGRELKDDFTDHETRLRIIEDSGTPLVQHMRGKFDQHVAEESAAILELQKQAIVASAVQNTKGAIMVSARTALVAFVSIITSIIVATAGAASMISGLAK
jgi:hypothetical protein